ncbi:MAG: hypothetical protein JWP97_3793 [Labilithrix sp.]|nr:hypothetical protein [Labilithrix sp.]
MESEVRALKRPEGMLPPPALPLPPGATSRMMILLADSASRHALSGEMDDARRITTDAMRLWDGVMADARSDGRIAALARFALGRALLAQHDPEGRRLLEDAGTCFEEIGDEAAVLAIDAALRQAAEVIEECPRSFASVPRTPR